MNIQSNSFESQRPNTPDEFLRWNEGREGKREFVRGTVVEMMIHVTRNHADIAANLIMSIGRRIDRSRFSIGSADFAVTTKDGVRYPDMYVDRRSPASTGRDLAATEPLLLAEILSPSSLARDLVEKLADYASVPSVAHYLVLSQEEPRVWLWSRDTTGSWDDGLEIAGLSQTFHLAGLRINVPLAELYDGVEIRALS